METEVCILLKSFSTHKLIICAKQYNRATKFFGTSVMLMYSVIYVSITSYENDLHFQSPRFKPRN